MKPITEWQRANFSSALFHICDNRMEWLRKDGPARNYAYWNGREVVRAKTKEKPKQTPENFANLYNQRALQNARPGCIPSNALGNPLGNPFYPRGL